MKENHLIYKGLQSKNVIQSNEITRSAQGLSLVEKRILMLALAQSSGVNKTLNIHAQEYADTFEIDVAIAYKQLKESSLNFMKRQFTLTSKHIVKNKIREIKTTYNWLSHVSYSKDDSALLEVTFNPNIYPLLFDITEYFTKYQLKQASALRSIYSVRLLELFESVRQSKTTTDKSGNPHSKKNKTGWLKISVDDFNHAMETPQSYRNNFADLKKRIIESAITELEQKDAWKIEYKTIKKGRKVAILEFEFYRDPQGRLF